MDNDRPPTQLLLACLGDASRFRIVEALIAGARCVTDLAVEVGLSQSCTTRHLQALERRGVVCGTRDGKRVLYRLCLDRPELEPLLAWALPAAVDGHPAVAGKPAGPRPAASRPAGRRTRPASPAPPAAPVSEPDVPVDPGLPGSDGPASDNGQRSDVPHRSQRPRPRPDLEDYLL